MSTKSVNIFLIGPMGAGKSTLGRRLAQELNFEFFDSDEEIIKQTGADLAWIFDLEGEEGFRRREAKMIAELTRKKGIVLATGGQAVIEEKNRQCLASYGCVVYLKVDKSRQARRLEKDKKRPLLQDKQKTLDETLARLEIEQTPYYEDLADIVIDTSQGGISQAVELIINELERL